MFFRALRFSLSHLFPVSSPKKNRCFEKKTVNAITDQIDRLVSVQPPSTVQLTGDFSRCEKKSKVFSEFLVHPRLSFSQNRFSLGLDVTLRTEGH
jgi:hypothetical protein